MKTTNPRIALVIVALLVAAACDEPRGSPTAPTPPTGVATGSTVTVTAITISGRTSIGEPGGTTQLTVTATFANGTAQDVTAQARWSSMADGILRVVSPGVVMAQSYGKGNVRVQYGNEMVNVELRVAPDGVFLVTVAVSDGQWAAEGVRVQVNSPAGTVHRRDGPVGGDLPAGRR